MTRVVQEHHISYQPEVTVDIYKGEHQILTLIQRYTQKTVSLGFIISLKHFIALNEHRAKKLTKKKHKKIIKEGNVMPKGVYPRTAKQRARLRENGKKGGRPREWLTDEELRTAWKIYHFHAEKPPKCGRCHYDKFSYGIQDHELRARCLKCGFLYTFIPNINKWLHV